MRNEMIACLACLLLAAVHPGPAHADEPASAPAAELLPIADFAREPTLSSPRLSPDARHLAVLMDSEDGTRHAVVIYKLEDMSVVRIMHTLINQVPLSPMWVSNDWLVLEFGKEYGSLEAPASSGEVIATNIDGSRQHYLYGSENKGKRAATRQSDEGFGFIAGRPAQPNGHVYVRSQPWGRENLSVVYDIDATQNTRRTLARMNVYGMSFLVDPAGEPEYAFGTNADFERVLYRRMAGNWQLQDAAHWGDLFLPIRYAPDGKHVYAWWSEKDGPRMLVESALDGSERKILARDEFADLGGVQWTAPPQRPFAVFPAVGAPEPIFIDEDLPEAKLYRALQQNFPGKRLSFINFSRDGGTLLFGVSADRDPGTYYVLDVDTHKLRKLFDAAPWIRPERMAARSSHRFKASDGVELEAILTRPPGRTGQKLPLVLVPHGGPHGEYDDVGWDEDAQFLANRGYLVLQVNFRGSGGRGDAFTHAGYLNWGTRIQEDLLDAVRWAVAEGFADPDRMCTYGGSFGGYSALMTVIRAPDMFRCAVGYAGIYDLRMMYTKGDIRTAKVGRSYLETVIGRDDAELDANSPARLAAQVKVPVLLVHGKEDQRAPFAQAEAMRAALKAAKHEPEWLAVAKEGHGFYSEENRSLFLARLETFLARHIGPDAVQTAAP